MPYQWIGRFVRGRSGPQLERALEIQQASGQIDASCRSHLGSDHNRLALRTHEEENNADVAPRRELTRSQNGDRAQHRYTHDVNTCWIDAIIVIREDGFASIPASGKR